MPIYEYVCRACGRELEKLQRFSDEPLLDCPECGAAELVKKVSAAGFRLKGGGWYVTDFRGDNKAKGASNGEDKSKSGEESGKGEGGKAKSGESPGEAAQTKAKDKKQDSKKQASTGGA